MEKTVRESNIRKENCVLLYFFNLNLRVTNKNILPEVTCNVWQTPMMSREVTLFRNQFIQIPLL